MLRGRAVAQNRSAVSALPLLPDLLEDFDQASQSARPSSPSAAFSAMPIRNQSSQGRSWLGRCSSAAVMAASVPRGSLGPFQSLVGAWSSREFCRTSSGSRFQAASRKARYCASATAGSRSDGTSTRLSSGHS